MITEPNASKLRTWQDRSGTFSVEAQFLGFRDAKLYLHKANGVRIAVPIEKMSIKDIEYLKTVVDDPLDDGNPSSALNSSSTLNPPSTSNVLPGGPFVSDDSRVLPAAEVRSSRSSRLFSSSRRTEPDSLLNSVTELDGQGNIFSRKSASSSSSIPLPTGPPEPPKPPVPSRLQKFKDILRTR